MNCEVPGVHTQVVAFIHTAVRVKDKMAVVVGLGFPIWPAGRVERTVEVCAVGGNEHEVSDVFISLGRNHIPMSKGEPRAPGRASVRRKLASSNHSTWPMMMLAGTFSLPSFVSTPVVE